MLDNVLRRQINAYPSSNTFVNLVDEGNSPKLQIKFKFPRWHFVIAGLLFSAMALFCSNSGLLLQVIGLPMGLYALNLFYRACFMPTDSITFDRVEGTVCYSYGALIIKRKPLIVPFGRLTFVLESDRMPRGGDTFHAIRIFHLNNMIGYPVYTTTKMTELNKYWSMIVWYMDKNRPLPPCTAFIPYRKVDYLRRKLDGFPKGLYYSVFKIVDKG